MFKVNFTRKTRLKLKKIGFITKIDGRHFINKDVEFELPCQFTGEIASLPIKIGAFSYVGNNFKNYVPLTIGRFCSIGDDVKIGLHNHPLDRVSTSPFFFLKEFLGKKISEKYFEAFENVVLPVIIEDDVWIGANACVKGGVKIGTGAIIACGAVVVKNVAPYEIVGGVPAIKIGSRQVQEIFAQKDFSEIGKKITREDFREFLPLKTRLREFFYEKIKK